MTRHHSTKPRQLARLFAVLALFLAAMPMVAATFTLGTASLAVGPATGIDSVIVVANPKTAVWTATNNASWLHLTAQNQSGTGSTNVILSYDANPGATRTGTLTIAGQTLTVTQAGSTYVLTFGPGTTLAASGLHAPTGVAVDAQGNVYIADNDNNAIKKWTVANNSLTTLLSTGLSHPNSLAVDAASNVYIANTYSNTIVKWTQATKSLTTLVSNGLNEPFGVALDDNSNVYIADTLNSAIKEQAAAGKTVTTLVSAGLNHPFGIAVDAGGNVYIADYVANAIKEWNVASNTLMTSTAFTNLNSPAGVAVDGRGNVYVADSGNNAIKKWTPAGNTVATLVSNGLSYPFGMAVDNWGNVYVADTLNNTIREFLRAFVDLTPKIESTAAGSDSLPAVLPATENLLPPFAPTSDQPWLTITGVTNGVVSFAFSDSGGTNRTAHLNLLGQVISVTQTGGSISPVTIINPAMTGNGAFQFAFSNNNPGASFTVLTSTNLLLPLTNWTIDGVPTNVAPGLFQFRVPAATNDLQRFYRVRSP